MIDPARRKVLVNVCKPYDTEPHSGSSLLIPLYPVPNRVDPTASQASESV